MKLLDTSGGNTKLRKTDGSTTKYRVAGLSMMPDDILCPYRNVAACKDDCLVETGRGVMRPVREGRQRKTDFWHLDQEAFKAQLRKELTNFDKLCKRQGIKGAVRLNVLSDIPWEHHDIPQEFPDLYFYDYTKNSSRLGKTPKNYDLMFSYSKAPDYQKFVVKALRTEVPVSVVFKNGMPKSFMGRRVIDGDASDLVNVKAGPVVIGLKFKGSKDKANDDFVVDASNLIAIGG